MLTHRTRRLAEGGVGEAQGLLRKETTLIMVS